MDLAPILVPRPDYQQHSTNMEMKSSRLVIVGLAAMLAALIAPPRAQAEIKLNELAGEWSGNGTDRDSPLASMQKTSCRSKIQSDPRRVKNEIVCSGDSGARKTIELQIRLDGDNITGELIQTQTTGREPPVVRKGSVSGRRTGDSADMQIQFSGFMPSAVAKLVIINPSSYSIRVTSMGASLMDVTFKKTGPANQPVQPGQAR